MAREQARSIIAELAKLGPEGERVLLAAGARLARGLAAGITSEEAAAIRAAQQTLEQVRREGEQQVLDAIRSARESLRSIGGDLSSQVADIIDLSPISAGLRREFERISSQRLTLDFRSAKQELRTVQNEIGKLGAVGTARRRQQEQILEPLRAAVARAQEDLDNFNARDAITNIEDLKQALDDLQESVTRRQLRFDLSQANIDLREAREALQLVGQATPAQRRAQAEFLAPFKNTVADAKAAIDEFTLQDMIDQQEDLNKAAKKTAEEGIALLVEQFDEGKISADEFAKKLRLELKPQLDLVARENLGLTLESEFLTNFSNLVAQAKALQGFARTIATAPGTGVVVKPAATQVQVNQRIAESAAALEQIKRDAITKSDEEQALAATTNRILRAIALALGATPGNSTRRR